MNQSVTKTVLNVGGNSKQIALPAHFKGFEHVLLDIDAARGPDLIWDARELLGLASQQYDAIYCSHSLEHFYRHDIQKVLKGFVHLLKPGGFVQIRVPDLYQIFKAVIEDKVGLDEVLYEAPAGSITPLDTIYGYGEIIQNSGNDYFAHKTGFTDATLRRALSTAGFQHVFMTQGFYEINCFATVRDVQDWVARLLDLQTTFGFDTLA